MAANQCIFCSSRSILRLTASSRSPTPRSFITSARPHPSRRRVAINASRRWQSTDAAGKATSAAAAPTPASSAPAASAPSSDPKIAQIVEQISGLTLLQTAELVTSLKSRLNIPDTPSMSFASHGGANPGVAAGGAAPAAVEEDDAPPPAQEKTLFDLKLMSFEAGSKPKVIKEIKSLLGLSLVDSKKFVESAPKTMREGVSKEEGGKIVETMKALGAVVAME